MKIRMFSWRVFRETSDEHIVFSSNIKWAIAWELGLLKKKTMQLKKILPVDLFHIQIQ